MVTQRQMPMVEESRRCKPAPDELVQQCRHRLDAIILCIQLSRLSQETICRELDIDKGHLTRMLQGRAYFPDTKTIALMQLCGNLAPIQFEAWRMGYRLVGVDEREDKIKALEYDIQRLRETG